MLALPQTLEKDVKADTGAVGDGVEPLGSYETG